MSDNPTSPLLGQDADTDERPQSRTSKSSPRSKSVRSSIHSDESTPLLSRVTDGHEDGADSRAATSLRSLQDGGSPKSKAGRRWPTIVALSILSAVVITILGLGFAMPAVIEEYVKSAAVFEPTDISIESFTVVGARARIRGKFGLDASRVEKKPVRDLGRFGTWIAKAAKAEHSQLKVYLPEYDDVLLGTASIPSIVVDIRNGHITPIDFLTDLGRGDVNGIRRIANDWLDGRLGQLRVQAVAKISIKSGIFSLGTQSISESIVLQGNDVPAFPKYNISKINIHEVELSDSDRGMAADVAVTLFNEHPVTFDVPPLGFEILIPGCALDGSSVLLANATTQGIRVRPKSEIAINVSGLIRHLPDTLTAVCPGTQTSPLDLFIGDYMAGDDSTVFVRGAERPFDDTPSWVSDLIKGVTVPLSVPGHPFDSSIRDFSMTDVHLSLPDPFAEPDDPEGNPRMSAIVNVLVNLPKEMNFPIGVSRVRADADVFYHDQKLGVLDMHKWQKSNSTHLEAHDGIPPGLAVQSIVKNVPLHITDEDVFANLVQAMLFGGEKIILSAKANVDVETESVIGNFVIRNIPAEGKVPIKPLSGNGVKSFAPVVDDLRILETTKSTMLIEATVNVTNPTNYSISIPYVSIHLLSNDTILGYVIAENMQVVPGPNNHTIGLAKWDPTGLSGEKGLKVGNELLSQFISGYNTTISLRTHAGTIPAHPKLGEALSSLTFKVPTPKLKNPNVSPGEDDSLHFIDDTTMHLLSSTATFTFASPFRHSTMFLTHVNATAFYNHTEPIGKILYKLPIAIPPGSSTSPRLPVDWTLDGVGYEAVKQALGGTLKLDAKAIAGCRIGEWEETLWVEAHGIGSHVKL